MGNEVNLTILQEYRSYFSFKKLILYCAIHCQFSYRSVKASTPVSHTKLPRHWYNPGCCSAWAPGPWGLYVSLLLSQPSSWIVAAGAFHDIRAPFLTLYKLHRKWPTISNNVTSKKKKHLKETVSRDF